MINKNSKLNFVLSKDDSKKNKIGKNIIRVLMSGATVTVLGLGVIGLSGCNSNELDVSYEDLDTNDVFDKDNGVSLSKDVSVSYDEVDNNVPTLEDKKREVFDLLDEVMELEVTLGKEHKDTLSKEEELLCKAREISDNLTDYEKAKILLVFDDNYARGMNQVDGMALTENEGLVSLTYLNGLKKSYTQADTEDVVLDFILDFETYWNKLNYDAKKCIQANILPTHDSYSKYGDLVSDYVLNSKDAKVLGYMIDKRLSLNNEIYNGNYDKARDMAIKLIEEDVKMYVCNEPMDLDGEKINVSTLSPWTQYLISFIAYADTSYVEDDTLITSINGCEIVNYHEGEKSYHYDSDMPFIQQDSARNNINWYLEANSVNATVTFIEPSKTLCK